MYNNFLQYFTDPVTGYVFRSFKDVDRYLKTGEVGKLAFKPKEKPRVSPDLGDDKSPVSDLVNICSSFFFVFKSVLLILHLNINFYSVYLQK